MQKVKFFTLSWSVRAASYHSAVLKALVDNSPDYIDIVMGDISQLPLFNPDLECEFIPVLGKIKSQLQFLLV